ncbi:hypothetical protein AB833_18770 [Chromatiales bacterium (ex Bugula neritina AB1)]|nr:hypothetical protein AB833_18770 [Chromatiales bacterium (ex Bugula neritina AB1)]
MRHRVFTYITRKRELLIFDHVDQRYLEPQIPGGTIESGEIPHHAAIREATEETGLENFRIVRFLGSYEKDLSPLGHHEKIHAWFYHLNTDDKTPERWRHFEEHSSATSTAIEFELYWVPVTAVPRLGGYDGHMLGKVRDSVVQSSL